MTSPNNLSGSDPSSFKSKRQRKAEKKALNALRLPPTDNDQEVVEPQAKLDVESGEDLGIFEEPISDNKTESSHTRKRGKLARPKNKPTGEVPGKSSARFIVFIGNLPFTATTESIQHHFAAVKPKSVRHLTHKSEPTKSRGCAFIEFEGFDHMKTCLRLYHHSIFDDGLSQPRKINVELTAGGGGKTKYRRTKIGQKNHKLNEERARTFQGDKSLRVEDKDDQRDVHPSRRAQMQESS